MNFFFSKPIYNEDEFILINYIPEPPPCPKIKDVLERHSYLKVKCKFRTFEDYKIYLFNKNKINLRKYKRKRKKRFRKH